MKTMSTVMRKLKKIHSRFIMICLAASMSLAAEDVFALSRKTGDSTSQNFAKKHAGKKLGGNNRKSVRIVYLDEMAVGTINIHQHGTVLSFPVKPEVHVGKKEVFDIIYVKNDLVISARMPGAVTNIFVYLLGRRFTLKLIYTPDGGDEIVAIRDPKDATMQVEVK